MTKKPKTIEDAIERIDGLETWMDIKIAGLATKTNVDQAMGALATKADVEEKTSTLTTKADFDQAMGALATKADVDEKIGLLATKADVEEKIGTLATRADVDQAIGNLAIMVEEGFNIMAKQEDLLALTGRVKSIEERLDGHDKEFRGMHDNFAIVFGELKSIRELLDRIEKNDLHPDVIALDLRVRKLEKKAGLQ